MQGPGRTSLSLYSCLHRRQSIVTQSTGCEDPELAEEIYQYYARPDAWNVAPGAPHALMRLRDAGEPRSLILAMPVSSLLRSSLLSIGLHQGLSEHAPVVMICPDSDALDWVCHANVTQKQFVERFLRYEVGVMWSLHVSDMGRTSEMSDTVPGA